MSTTKQKLSTLITPSAVHTAVLTPQGSKAFVRKLIPAAIASILHQRTSSNKDDFTLCKYNEQEYTIFKYKVQEPVLKTVVNWITGALDAFDRNYLRELYLVFVDANKGTEVIESYKFQFRYMGDDVILLDPPSTEKELVGSTERLLNSFHSLTCLPPLQLELEPCVVLTYYEDVTPSSYEPPFLAPEDEILSKIMDNVAKSTTFLNLGNLTTGFHFVKSQAQGTTLMTSTDYGSDGNFDVINDKSDGNNVDALVDNSKDTIEPKDSILSNYVENNYKNHLGNNDEIIVIEDSSQSSITDQETPIYNCMCGINVAFNSIAYTKCVECLSWQHAPCVGFLYAEDVPKDMVCDDCSDHSIILSPHTLIKQRLTCIYRLALSYAHFNSVVPFDVMERAFKNCKSYILNQLCSYGIVEQDGDSYMLNKSNLEKAINSKVFIKRTEEDKESMDLGGPSKKLKKK